MSLRLSFVTLGCTVLVAAYAARVEADPVVLQPSNSYPFTIYVAAVYGDLSGLFAEPIQHGSRISGRVVVDGPPSADSTPDPGQGNYTMSGRFLFDDPAGPVIESGPVAPLRSFVADNFAVGDLLGFELHQPFFPEDPAAGDRVLALVVWTDVTRQALTGDSFPQNSATLSGFNFTQFQLIEQPGGPGHRQIGFRGTSEPPGPIPEPSTLLLTLMGGSGIASAIKTRVRRHRTETITQS